MFLCLVEFVFLGLKIMVKAYNIVKDDQMHCISPIKTLNLEKISKDSTDIDSYCTKWVQVEVLWLRDQVGWGQALISKRS